MSKPQENHRGFFLVQKLVAELIGTYILVFFGGGSAFIAEEKSISLEGVALTCAVVLIAIIYAIGHISGSHVNPAVSIALAAIGRFPWKEVPLYAAAQLTGSTFASLTLLWLFDGKRLELMLTLPVGPNPASDARVVAWEIIATCILMFVICGAALDPRASKGLGGIAVGGAIFVNVITAGTVSGSSMNPARSIGPAIINLNFNKLWIYIISPITGALFGSSLYHFLQITKEPEAEDLHRNASCTHDDSGTNNGYDNPIYFDKSMQFP